MDLTLHNVSYKIASDLPKWQAGRSLGNSPGKTRSRRRGRRWAIAEFYPFHSWREMCAAKRDAALAVKAALRRGDLSHEPCRVCASPRAEAHHDDYSKPIDVLWLCRHHHRLRDAELKDARVDALKGAEAIALPLSYLKRAARLQPVPSATVHDHERRRSFVARDYSLALVTQVTKAIFDRIEAADIPTRELCQRLGVSRQAVQTHFDGGFRTLKLLAAYADALGCDVEITLRPKA